MIVDVLVPAAAMLLGKSYTKSCTSDVGKIALYSMLFGKQVLMMVLTSNLPFNGVFE